MSDTDKPLLRNVAVQLQKRLSQWKVSAWPNSWSASLLAFAVGCLLVMTSSALVGQSRRPHAAAAAAAGSLGGLYAGAEGSLLVAPRAATGSRRVLEDGSCPCSSGTAADPSIQPRPKRRILIFYHIFVANQWLSVLEDQISKMVYSGLYHEASTIICGIAASTQEDIQQAANMLAAYGTKFDIGAAQVNSPLNERLTMNLIRERAAPSDRVLCVTSHFLRLALIMAAPAEEEC